MTASNTPARVRHPLVKALATAAALSLAVTACGGSAEPAAGGDGNVTLSVTVWNMAKTPEFKALFDAFEAANPGIKIKPVDILADDYAEKVTTMLAGGDKSDVITMKNVTDYSRYSSRGQLQEITDLAKSGDAAKLAGLDAFDVSGKYFALPYRQDFWLLYYNKTYLDKAGVKAPETLTWDEYAKLAQQLTKDEGGKKVYGTYHHTWRSVVQAISAAQTGGDQLSGEYSFFTDQYNVALGLQKAGATLDFGTAMAQKSDYKTMFETGATAMLPMGTWYIAALMEAKKSGKTDVDWALAPMPQRPGGSGVTTFGSPTAFAVNKKAEHADAAKKFVQFAASKAGAEAISKVGVVPALQSPEITSAYFALDGMPTDEVSKKAFEPDKVNLEMPVSENTSDIDTILKEEHELIMVGDKSVADGIKSMNERVKSEVLN
ncbi:carbohydrate ABC transporter substrate-binding protein (CUT1 family) [Nonomuraea polychroma]|uniref:Carbohydrate ABC transporter substrate-binding protein (CUT1 family) n=1 Tax=Nonomuraea polychroma TaxID=46176 RepID=A0A438MP82_9ACTN|nr:sugar ABC transporter substrate-binding protein [Nonomuraea polychroma]RVX47637.1 carbohydrate ABC transporter substrate-binding protein (CUT1 family) [Nonomuraea polychroma]